MSLEKRLAALTEKYNTLRAAHKKLSEEFKASKRDPLGDLEFDSGRLETDLISNKQNRIDALTESVKNLTREGLNFEQSQHIKKGAAGAIESIDLLLGSAKKGAESYRSLAKGIGSFAEMAKIAGKDIDTFTAKLAKHQAVLKRAGVSNSDFQKTVDTTTFSLKQNSDQVEKINLRLAQFARQSGISSTTVSRNYNMLAKNLMVDSATIERELLRTQKIQQQTGVSVSDQQSAFSGVTTDFSAASQMAGNLNALLGGNKLSATEIFMSLTPGEVQEKVKEALKGTRMEEDLTYSGKDRNRLKARQLAIATLARNTNMSADNVRRMYGLEDGEAESVQGQLIKSTDKTFKQFDGNLRQSAKTIEQFAQTTQSATMKITEILKLEQRKMILKDFDQQPDTLKALQRAAVFADSGALPQQFDGKKLIGLDTDQMTAITRLNLARRIAPKSAKQIKTAMKKIFDAATPDQRERSMAAAERLINTTTRIGDKMLVKDLLIFDKLPQSGALKAAASGFDTEALFRALFGKPETEKETKERKAKEVKDQKKAVKVLKGETAFRAVRPTVGTVVAANANSPAGGTTQVIQVPVSIDGTKVAEAVATVMYPSGMA